MTIFRLSRLLCHNVFVLIFLWYRTWCHYICSRHWHNFFLKPGEVAQAIAQSIFLRSLCCQMGDFLPIGLLLEDHNDFFEKMKKPKIMVTFWAIFCFSKFITFLPYKQFQKLVCCRYFKVLKVVRCRCFGFSNYALLQIFWPFLTWQLFCLFFEKFGNFF